jgi:hypothetical protein
VANCPHGFPEDQCLICQTLGVRHASPVTSAKAGKAAKPAKVEATTRGGLVLADDDLARSLPTRRNAQLEAPGAAPQGRRASGKANVLAGLALIVVGGLLVWVFGGLFRLAFHIFEYAALAIVSGWVGYKLGHLRGRRERRKND